MKSYYPIKSLINLMSKRLVEQVAFLMMMMMNENQRHQQ